MRGSRQGGGREQLSGRENRPFLSPYVTFRGGRTHSCVLGRQGTLLVIHLLQPSLQTRSLLVWLIAVLSAWMCPVTGSSFLCRCHFTLYGLLCGKHFQLLCLFLGVTSSATWSSFPHCQHSNKTATSESLFSSPPGPL